MVEQPEILVMNHVLGLLIHSAETADGEVQ